MAVSVHHRHIAFPGAGAHLAQEVRTLHETATAATHQHSAPKHLLGSLQELLDTHRPAFRQERVFRRMKALLFGQLFSFARRTVTQALVTLGLTDSDWSAFYRIFNEPRMDYEALTG